MEQRVAGSRSFDQGCMDWSRRVAQLAHSLKAGNLCCVRSVGFVKSLAVGDGAAVRVPLRMPRSAQ